MQTLTKFCEQVVERVQRGLDVVVEGDPETVRTTLQAATLRLAATHGVVTVAGPAGGLSLSGLIAQLSGRGNLDDHDDSVLELGVRRLTDAAVPGQRTVMVLDAPSGVHRSAFRFLRQVARRAPDLIYVIAAFPEMPAMLAEPGMEALQERFGATTVVAGDPDEHSDEAADVVDAGPSPLAAAEPAAVTIPPEWRDLRAVPLSTRLERRRRGAVWAAAGVGLAASVTLGAWLGTRTSAPTSAMQAYEGLPATSGAIRSGMASVPAQVSLPAVVADAVPAMVGSVAPAVVVASAAPTVVARAAPPLVGHAAPPLVASAGPPLVARAVPSLVALPRAVLARPARPEMASAPAAPGVSTSTIAEASLALDPSGLAVGRDEAAAEGMALAGLPRDLGRSGSAGPPRPTRLAAPAPEERRRTMSPKPQRLATLPMSPGAMSPGSMSPGPVSPRARWTREEKLDEEAGRDLRTYPGGVGGDETYAPPVRYRRYTPPEPVWRGERSVAPAEGPYIGTYEPGPYGARVFRYSP